MSEASTETPAAKKPKAPPVKVSALKIETGVPVAKQGGGERGSSWLPLIKQIEPGQSVFVEGRTAQSLAYVRGLGKDHDKNLTIRSVVEDGKSGARIYCLSDEEAKQEAETDAAANGEGSKGAEAGASEEGSSDGL